MKEENNTLQAGIEGAASYPGTADNTQDTEAGDAYAGLYEQRKNEHAEEEFIDWITELFSCN